MLLVLLSIPLALVVQKEDGAIHWMNRYLVDVVQLVSPILIHWIVIYQAVVVQTLDRAIHRINSYPVGKC